MGKKITTKHHRKAARHNQPNRTKRRWWRRWSTWILLFFIISMIGGAAYAKLRGTIIVDRDDGSVPVALSSATDLSRLTKEGDARLNILLLGQGGEGHKGATLTDTMQVMSIDLDNQQAALLSIPRDLYVKTKYGSMKINAIYQAANSQAKDSGGQAVKDVVGQIVDLDLHYFVAIDFDGFVKLVDLLGGIDVTVKNALNDYEYPNSSEDGYTTFRLAAGAQHLDGATALKYARSRHSSGVEGSDFARSARQQQVITAIKEKAAAQGYFKNPFKLVQLVGLLTNYVRTDMGTNEMKTLADKIGGLSVNNISSAVLSNSEAGLLIDGKISGAGYTLVPRAGNFDYTAIGRLMHSLSVDPLIKKEAARIYVEYPAAKEKSATATIDLLQDYGYQIVGSATADVPRDQKQALIIDHRQQHPYTVHYLQNRLTALTETNRTDRDDIDLTIILPD